jgi:hypothetical protein
MSELLIKLNIIFKNFFLQILNFFYSFFKTKDISGTNIKVPIDISKETLDNDLKEESLFEYFAKEYFNNISF